MGFRWRKSIKILPGIKLNLSTGGASVSIGPKGAKLNIGSRGARVTTSIPGTGISYSKQITSVRKKSSAMSQCPYCGHKMRKVWEKCPKCHSWLVQNTGSSTSNGATSIPPPSPSFSNGVSVNGNNFSTQMLCRGERGYLRDYINAHEIFDVVLNVNGNAVYDYVCFGLNGMDNLVDDRYMVFYNQPCAPNDAIICSDINEGRKFSILLDRLPAFVTKLVFTISIDGTGIMRDIRKHTADIMQNGKVILHTEFNGKEFSQEKSIISLEIYRHDDWKFKVVAYGYKDGLSSLLAHYGGHEI